MILRKGLIFIILALLSGGLVWAEDEIKKEEYNASETIVHHVMDSHDWHITDWPNGQGGYTPVALHLPWFFL